MAEKVLPDTILREAAAGQSPVEGLDDRANCHWFHSISIEACGSASSASRALRQTAVSNFWCSTSSPIRHHHFARQFAHRVAAAGAEQVEPLQQLSQPQQLGLHLEVSRRDRLGVPPDQQPSGGVRRLRRRLAAISRCCNASAFPSPSARFAIRYRRSRPTRTMATQGRPCRAGTRHPPGSASLLATRVDRGRATNQVVAMPKPVYRHLKALAIGAAIMADGSLYHESFSPEAISPRDPASHTQRNETELRTTEALPRRHLTV